MQLVPTTTTIAVRDEVFTTEEEQALIGFLAGYGGLTRDAYQLDLRQWVQWCAERQVALFGARRADIEGFGRALEARGRARATVARRLCTIACFYRYAEEEGLIPISPAVHVRRPRLDYESHATGLDRNEVGAMLVAAGLGGPQEHALLSLLALNDLRVSEAIGADIQQLGLERGHRTLTILRKGGKIVTIPLAPRTARAVDLAIGNAAKGRSSKPPTATGWTATPLHASFAGSHAAPGSPNGSARTLSGTRSSPPRSTPVSPFGTCKKLRAMPTRARPCVTTAPA
jgi:integrase/recombinase XerD